MADVEARAPRTSSVNNPYTGDGPPMLPQWHPLNILKRGAYMGGAIYGLLYFDAYENLMKSPDIGHEWFKIGLATTVVVLFIKAYVEMYAGKLKKQKINYKTFPQSTHSVMILILLSSIAFHAALWPVYHSKSMLIMFLVATFLLNFCLLFPTYIQNLTAFSLLTFFIQEYK